MKENCFNRTQEKIADLDLSKEKGQRPSICVAEYKINFKKHKTWFGCRTPEGTLHLQINSNCDLDDKDDKIIIESGQPLTLECKEEKGDDIEVQINGEQYVMLKVWFCPAVIEDCNNPKIEQFKIHYNIKCKVKCKSRSMLSRRDTDDEKNESGDAIVSLAPIAVDPELLLNPKSFLYEPKRMDTTLRISNSSDKLYAPSIGIKISSVKLYDTTRENLFSDAVEVQWDKAKASNTNSLGGSGFVVKSHDSTPKIVNSEHEIENIHPNSGYYIGLPISIDLSKISSPQKEYESYKLYIDYVFWDSKDSRRRSDRTTLDIRVIKNKQRIELGVNLQGKYPDGYKNLLKIEGDSPSDKPIVVNSTFTHKTYRIAVENTATILQPEHPNAGIVIKDFKSSNIEFKTNDIVAKSSDNKVIDLGSICRIVPTNNPEIILLPNTPPVCIDIDFVGNNQISCFEKANGERLFSTEAKVDLSFNYYIDETGERNNTQTLKHFKGTVYFKFEIEPCREWLGIDFGTSAVVALYGNSINLQTGRPQNCLKNLKEIKEKGLSKAYPNGGDLKSVTDEEFFINSRIVLGEKFPEGVDEVKDFVQYPKGKILFSPGDSFTYTKLLPSLKSMMGYKCIPNLMGSSGTPPLVNDIYKMTFKQLFNLYLNNISNSHPIEKVFMTYPNTFAPVHITELKKIAKECLPRLRDEYFITISESDAVAFHYLMKRRKLLGNAGNDVDRNVLIYDMGAGTLDITYFSNIFENDKRIIDIKGKFGINKAGNYLDYVLAKIVVDICRKHELKDANNQYFDSYIDLKSKTDTATRTKLKNYVKNLLKPMLADIEDINIASDLKMPNWDVVRNGGSLDEIPLSEVYQHDDFCSFINDISTEVIEGCDRLFPGGLHHVDAVVFSGRMTSMKAIRKAVEKAINTKAESAVMSFDIAEDKNDLKDQLQERKTAVVKGALSYVESFLQDGEIVLRSSKPFFARYCVILFQQPDIYKVINIVDNSMEDCNFTSKKDVKLSNVYALYLIQTYAMDENAIISDYIGDRNLTTVLSVLPITNNLNGTFPIYVQVNPITKEVVFGVDDDSDVQLPHDNIDSQAFRKSAWPIIF